MQDQLPPFHLSIPVSDLAKAREFYLDVVGCKEGRSKANRVDFSLFGHHIVAHHMPSEAAHEIEKVVAEGNGERFPVRHFGVKPDAARLAQFAREMTAGAIEPSAIETMPLAAAAEAHRRLEAGGSPKLVLL